MLFDTDVLIWVFRDKPSALRAIKEHPERQVSVATYMELLQGVRTKAESVSMRRWLCDASFQILPLKENIGQRASMYMEEYALSHGLDLPDALVAATAIENNLPLCTGNVKHFKMIAELQLSPFDPRG